MDEEKDDRKWKRYSYQVPISVSTRDNPSFQASTLDISGGGIKLLSPQSFEEEKQIPLTIRIEDVTIHPLVKIRRVEEETPGNYSMALQFLHLPHDEKKLLEKILYRLSLPKTMWGQSFEGEEDAD